MKKIFHLKKYIKNFLKKGKSPYRDYPFGRQPKASKQSYIDLWEAAKIIDYPIINNFEKELGFTIEKTWLDNLALHTQVVIKKSKISYQHGRILYSALCNYIKHNNYLDINIIEIGTARGFSSLCMAKSLNFFKIEGKIITIDPLPHKVKMFWNCIDDWDGEKTREQLLSNYKVLTKKYINFIEGESENELPKIKLSRIHFAFIDGTHEYENIIMEFNFVASKQLAGDIIILDDYTPNLFPGVVKSVDYVCKQYNYSKRVIDLSNERGYVIAIKN